MFATFHDNKEMCINPLSWSCKVYSKTYNFASVYCSGIAPPGMITEALHNKLPDNLIGWSARLCPSHPVVSGSSVVSQPSFWMVKIILAYPRTA